jgi:hypothetical protein
MIPDQYRNACKATENIQCTSDEALALPAHPQILSHEHFRTTGLFLSALYNKLRMPIIFYEHDTPDIANVGYEYWGILVNMGHIGDYASHYQRGVTINLGTAGCAFGTGARGVINLGVSGNSCAELCNGIIINDGEAGSDFAGDARHAKVIVMQEPASYDYKGADLIAPTPAIGTFIKELRAYALQPAAFAKRYRSSPDLQQELLALIEVKR